MQVRELALAAGEAELQELYLAVPGLLSERRSDAAAACALLQVCRRRSWCTCEGPVWKPEHTLMLSSVLPSLRMLMDGCPISSRWLCRLGCGMVTSALEHVVCWFRCFC